MKHFVAIIIFILPTPIKYSEKLKNYFVIWNVGQGQWITLIKDGHCYHFDIGGEKPSHSKFNYCRSHEIYLSHLDQDHISFIKRLKKSCVQPLSPAQIQFYSSKKPQKLINLEKTPECHTSSELFDYWKPSIRLNIFLKTDNDLSSVFQINNQILIPGDSTIKAENYWQSSKKINLFKILIAGHHGSRTSTGSQLLEHMKNLKLVIFSSRFEKYHHPHSEVLDRLKAKKIPNLSTEDWGSIGFILNE